jgi:hypothetical protein
MTTLIETNLAELLELLGLAEPPTALCWSDEEPAGFAPEPGSPRPASVRSGAR